MNFESYLQSKKIDPDGFKAAEPKLYEDWRTEFDQINPVGFTAQKLYLINPIRRLYHLKVELKPAATVSDPKPLHPETNTEVLKSASSEVNASNQQPATPTAKPAVPRPVFRPKPKMN